MVADPNDVNYSIPVTVSGTEVEATAPYRNVFAAHLINPLLVPFGKLNDCIQHNPSLNKSNEYFSRGATPIPWQFPTPFAQLPLSLDSICQNSGNGREIRGFGLKSDIYKSNLPTRWHLGVDFFGYSPAVRPTGVYSIANNGIVAGIGIGGSASTSADYYGSDIIAENGNRGFSVIVRYGHLYVLYGHLIEVDKDIYVGRTISQGTRIGSLGTFKDVDTGYVADPHLHLEIRSAGTGFQKGQLVIAAGHTKGNDYGILLPGGGTIDAAYDVVQFFTTSPTIRVQDYETAIATVSPLDPTLQNETVIMLGPTCNTKYLLSAATAVPGATPIVPDINSTQTTINTTFGSSTVVIRSLVYGLSAQAGSDPIDTPDPNTYN